MNIYSLDHTNKKLTVALDLKNIVTLKNKEIDMLASIITSNLNRKTQKKFNQADIKELLLQKIEFPLKARTYELTFDYNKNLELKFTSFAIINQDLSPYTLLN